MAAGGVEYSDKQESVQALTKDAICAVVILSARADPTDKIRALQDGAADYLTKPISTRDSIDRIQRILKPDLAADGGP